MGPGLHDSAAGKCALDMWEGKGLMAGDMCSPGKKRLRRERAAGSAPRPGRCDTPGASPQSLVSTGADPWEPGGAELWPGGGRGPLAPNGLPTLPFCLSESPLEPVLPPHSVSHCEDLSQLGRDSGPGCPAHWGGSFPLKLDREVPLLVGAQKGAKEGPSPQRN